MGGRSTALPIRPLPDLFNTSLTRLSRLFWNLDPFAAFSVRCSLRLRFVRVADESHDPAFCRLLYTLVDYPYHYILSAHAWNPILSFRSERPITPNCNAVCAQRERLM